MCKLYLLLLNANKTIQYSLYYQTICRKKTHSFQFIFRVACEISYIRKLRVWGFYMDSCSYNDFINESKTKRE